MSVCDARTAPCVSDPSGSHTPALGCFAGGASETAALDGGSALDDALEAEEATLADADTGWSTEAVDDSLAPRVGSDGPQASVLTRLSDNSMERGHNTALRR